MKKKQFFKILVMKSYKIYKLIFLEVNHYNHTIILEWMILEIIIKYYLEEYFGIRKKDCSF